MQPVHIALANFTSHVCLCAKKLETSNSTGEKVGVNPNTVANQSQEEDALELLSSNSITYAVWEKVNIVVDVLVKKMKIVDTELQKENFKTLSKHLLSFKNHVVRV